MAKKSLDTSSPRKKRLTLLRLLDAKEEIWVRNNSGKVFKNKVCNVVFQVGRPPAIDVVVIPPGEDPVCLTDQVDPESLRSCMDLFKLVNKDVLVILDPEDADLYYKQNQERKLIVEEKIESLAARRVDREIKRTEPQRMGQTVRLNPKIGDVCLKSRHAAITERQALERVMEMSSILTLDDVSYLSNNGVYAGVKQWAQQRMQELLQADAPKEEESSEEEFEEAVKKVRKRRVRKAQAVEKDPVEEALS